MTQLAQYPRIRAALAEAAKIEDVLPIMDEIEHVKLYARQIEDQELLADAAEYQMRAERRLGTIIAAAKAAGHFAEGRRKKAEKNGTDGEPFRPATLEEVGVSKKLSSKAQKRSGIAEKAFEALVRATRDRIASGRANVVAESVNGARAIMGSRVEDADSLDYSPTPPYGTRALMERVLPQLGIASLGTAWEPACGEGHIAEVLTEYGASVFASDIAAYGYGTPGMDFLADQNPYPKWLPQPDWIITNPPFGDKAEQFALRALERAKVGVAIFARLQWLETIGRYERLFRDQPPTLISFFCERVALCMGRWDPEGGTATAYIWLVWVKGQAPRAPFWIPPGCKTDLTKPDDVERFTAHPVIKRSTAQAEASTPQPKDAAGETIRDFDRETGEVVEQIYTIPPEQDEFCIPEFLRRPS